MFYLLCFHLLFYYYYYYFFLCTTDHPQSINTTNQHSRLTQTDQHTINTNGPTQQIKNLTNTRSTTNPQPTTNLATTTVSQTHNTQQLPTTHDKPNHNHGNSKTPPTTTVNPQKSQTQNNQKIKREIRSDWQDCEPNATTVLPKYQPKRGGDLG